MRSEDIARLHERMDELGTEITAVVGPAVAKGIREAISDPATWAAVFSMAHREAAGGLGRFGISTVWGAMRWMLRFVVLGLVVYAVGGWSALSALFKGAWEALLGG